MTVRDIIDRETDPGLPPWLSVRFWLTIAGLIVSVVALVMAA